MKFNIPDDALQIIYHLTPDTYDLIMEYSEEESKGRYVSREERYGVLKRQGWCCNVCGCKLKYSKEQLWVGEVAHIDHIHPYSKRESYPKGVGSINESLNLQAFCPSCNLSKGKKEIN